MTHEPADTLAAQIKHDRQEDARERCGTVDLRKKSRKTPSWQFVQIASFPMGHECRELIW